MSKFQYLEKGGANTTITVFLKRHLDIRNKSGFEWQAICPFHEDTSPSLSVNIRKGVYICYACGAKGNIKTLAKHFDDNAPSLVEASLDEVMETISQLSEQSLMTKRPEVGIKYPAHFHNSKEAKDYWIGVRNLTEGQFNTYQLGFDIIENEAIIPIKDLYGRCLGVIRRTVDQDKLDAGYPKYRYPKGLKISRCLYGAGEASDYFVKNKEGKSVLVVCEGSVDAISVLGGSSFLCHSSESSPITKRYYTIAGVAVLGARISYSQATMISSVAPDHIVVATDQDRVGRLAALQIESQLKKLMLGCFIHQLTWDIKEGKDLAELPLAERMKKITACVEQK